jgi:hypothetical protein
MRTGRGTTAERQCPRLSANSEDRPLNGDVDGGRSCGRVPSQHLAGTMKKQTREPKTWGTAVAGRNRAKANRLTDSERERLMARGLDLIYGGPAGRERVQTHSR